MAPLRRRRVAAAAALAAEARRGGDGQPEGQQGEQSAAQAGRRSSRGGSHGCPPIPGPGGPPARPRSAPGAGRALVVERQRGLGGRGAAQDLGRGLLRLHRGVGVSGHRTSVPLETDPGGPALS
ncbi:MAG: hypothetical protein ACK559_04190, partial [bacterium]